MQRNTFVPEWFDEHDDFETVMPDDFETVMPKKRTWERMKDEYIIGLKNGIEKHD